MSAASLGAGSSHTKISEAILVPYRRYRPLILAATIGLHAGILIYATLLKPADTRPPEILPVAMMQLISQPSPTASLQALMPEPKPKPKPIAKPKPKPVAASAPPVAKVTPQKAKPLPVVKKVVDQPAVSVPEVAQSEPPSKAAEETNSKPAQQSSSASAAQTQAAASAPVSKAEEAASPPSFSAAYLNNPPPAYPPLARRMGEEGKVMLRVYVTPQGTAGEVKIQTSSGSSMFDDAAQAAVKSWRFVPAKQGENAVAAWVQVPIVFKLS